MSNPEETVDENVPTTRLNFKGTEPAPIASEPAGVTAATADIDPVIEEAVEDTEGPSTEATDTGTEASTDGEEVPLDEPVSDGSADTQETSTETSEESSEADPVETEAEDQKSESVKSIEELAAERDRIDAELKARKENEQNKVIDQIKTVMASYDISLQQLVDAMGGLKATRKGTKAKIKYRDPASGATWSGRGKAPDWIKGKDFGDFLLPEDEQIRPE